MEEREENSEQNALDGTSLEPQKGTLDDATEKQQDVTLNNAEENENQAKTSESQDETNEIIKLENTNEDENENSASGSVGTEQGSSSSDEKQTENTDVKHKKVHTSETSQRYGNESKSCEMKEPKLQLSARLEHIARPKKDFLETKVEGRLDGSVPEGAPPMWQILPLQTKIPLNECPLPVATKKIGSNLFLPTPGKDFDLWDENNHLLPSERYDRHHDPHLKIYYKTMPSHLKKEGYVTESGRATCTLNDINVYRRYQRRIIAAEVQQKLRDEDEEFKRKRAAGTEERIKRDVEKYHEKRTQGRLRRWIKDTVASIEETSMTNQMIRDMKVLNSQIRRDRAQRERVEIKEERYQQVFAQHVKDKYDIDEAQKETHLAFAKKDAEILLKLHQKEVEKKQQKKEKVEEFWKRKYEWQEGWIDLGVELEKIREQEKQTNLEILKQTGRLPLVRGIQKINQDSTQHSSNVKVEDQKINETEQSHLLDAVAADSTVQKVETEDQKINEDEQSDLLDAVAADSAVEKVETEDQKINEAEQSHLLDAVAADSTVQKVETEDQKTDNIKQSHQMDTVAPKEYVQIAKDGDKKTDQMNQSQQLDTVAPEKTMQKVKDEDQKRDDIKESDQLNTISPEETIQNIKSDDQKTAGIKEHYQLNTVEPEETIQNIKSDDQKTAGIREHYQLNTVEPEKVEEIVKSEDHETDETSSQSEESDVHEHDISTDSNERIKSQDQSEAGTVEEDLLKPPTDLTKNISKEKNDTVKEEQDE